MVDKQTDVLSNLVFLSLWLGISSLHTATTHLREKMITWLYVVINMFTCIRQLEDKTHPAAQRLESLYPGLLISSLWPKVTYYYKHSISPLYLSVPVFIISVWASSVFSPRERASSEASSSQPTNNTWIQAMVHFIPLWVHVAKWNCTRLLEKCRHYICAVSWLLACLHFPAHSSTVNWCMSCLVSCLHDSFTSWIWSKVHGTFPCL